MLTSCTFGDVPRKVTDEIFRMEESSLRAVLEHPDTVDALAEGGLAGPSGNSPSSLQVWTMQLSCSVVVVESDEGELVVVDIELLLSFSREAEKTKGTRAKRNSFMVDNLGFLDFDDLLATVALASVAPLFYTSPPRLIKAAYFT